MKKVLHTNSATSNKSITY